MDYPCFIIHSQFTTERDGNVFALVQKTAATVVEAEWAEVYDYEARKQGCARSHMKVAALAKEISPETPYLVFEDDCELSDDWKDVLLNKESFDLVYLGLLPNALRTPFGTHAMLVSPKCRDAILSETEALATQIGNKWAFDHILHEICKTNCFCVWRPQLRDNARYAKQKLFPSTITQMFRSVSPVEEYPSHPRPEKYKFRRPFFAKNGI